MHQYTFILFAVLLTVGQISCLSNDTQAITIGPNEFVVGINLDETTFPANVTVYNIVNSTDPLFVHDIIQQAITDIGLIGGGIINIKAGTYIIAKNLNILSNGIHLKGEGIDKTIIQLVDKSSAIVSNSQKYGFVRALNCDNLIISDLTLDGNRANQLYDQKYLFARYGIYTEGCSNVLFNKIKSSNFQDYGFSPRGLKLNNIWANDLTITDCVASNNGLDGFKIDQILNVLIKNCLSENNGKHGFNIGSGSKNVTLINNIARENGFNDNSFDNTNGCGYTVQNNFFLETSDVLLENNQAINNLKAGVCLSDVFNIFISNNNIEGACTCEDKVNKTCTCFNFLNVNSVIIEDNICTSLRFSNAQSNGQNTTENTENNTFNKIEYCEKDDESSDDDSSDDDSNSKSSGNKITMNFIVLMFFAFCIGYIGNVIFNL